MMPLGHWMRRSTFRRVAQTKAGAQLVLTAEPGPAGDFANCETVLPPIVAFSRTLAPMAERFESRPEH
jgi:hypothetical protein